MTGTAASEVPDVPPRVVRWFGPYAIAIAVFDGLVAVVCAGGLFSDLSELPPRPTHVQLAGNLVSCLPLGYVAGLSVLHAVASMPRREPRWWRIRVYAMLGGILMPWTTLPSVVFLLLWFRPSVRSWYAAAAPPAAPPVRA